MSAGGHVECVSIKIWLQSACGWTIIWCKYQMYGLRVSAGGHVFGVSTRFQVGGVVLRVCKKDDAL